MVNSLRCIGMTLPLVMVALGADSVTGKWALVGPDVLDLKADGARLTGSVTHHGWTGYPGSTPTPPVVTPISKGKVDGNHIYFEVVRELGGHSVTTKYEGKISGDKIDLNITINLTVPVRQGNPPKATHVVAKKL
jgi:hypothetical protein